MKRTHDVGPKGDRPVNVLDIAELTYESGVISYRFSRYLSSDGTKWVRHGLSVRYHESGGVASQGEHVDGEEQGLWQDFHETGQLAAEGCYLNGKEHGYWQFWDETGREEKPVEYEHGAEVS